MVENPEDDTFHKWDILKVLAHGGESGGLHFS